MLGVRSHRCELGNSELHRSELLSVPPLHVACVGFKIEVTTKMGVIEFGIELNNY